MINFFGRPLRASFTLPMALLAARARAQDVAPTPVPPVSEVSAASKQATPDQSDAAKAKQAESENKAADMNATPDKHVLGVLPNYRTGERDGGAFRPSIRNIS